MWKFSLFLCLTLSPIALAQEDPQIALLRQIFRSQRGQWTQILEQHRAVLDDSFFEKCQQRIEWDLRHEMADDALRFAILADCAAEVMGRPVHFQKDFI